MLKDKVLTHNHPGIKGVADKNITFSSVDIMTAVRADVFEMRAVSADRTYRFYRGRVHVGNGKNFIDKKMDEVFNEIFQKHFDKLESGEMKDISVKAMNAVNKKVKQKLEIQIYKEAQTRTIKEFADKFNWVYEELPL